MDKLKNLWAKVKNYKKQVLIGAVVVAAISAGVVIYNHNSDSGYVTVDISQIYVIDTSFLNNNSYKPHVRMSTDVNEREFIESIIFKLNPNASIMTYTQYQNFFRDLEKNFEINKTENISPGDEIIATLSYDKSKVKDLKLKLKNTTLKLTA